MPPHGARREIAFARAAWSVDHRVNPVEREIAHVNDVGLFKVNDDVSFGVRRAEILGGDDLVP